MKNFLPNQFGLTFHHLGLAVRQPTEINRFLCGLGYSIGEIIHDPEQNVHLAMCLHPVMPNLEIIYPADGAGPLDTLLERHKDGLVYHICYVTQDLDATLDALESSNGIRLFCVSPPKPAVLFGGARVSFYLVAGVGLIEILDQGSAGTA